MSGLEVGGIATDTDAGNLILETEINNRWRYASFRRTKRFIAEAEEWEAAKKKVGGLHFLALQTDPDSENVAGFWMLRDLDLASMNM